MKTIPEQFFETASQFPNRPALKFKFQKAYITVSFRDLERRVKTLANGLKNLGVETGDRVAIFSENRTEWVRADLATLTIGAITVPIHTTVSPLIIEHVINNSGAQTILVSNQKLFNQLLLVINNLPTLKNIIYIELDQQLPEIKDKKIISLKEVMKLGEEGYEKINSVAEIDDVASIIYTSGTTAAPKGVMLTHRNFIFDAEAAVTVVPVTEKDVLLSFMPLSHVLERTVGYYAPLVCRGACIAYAQSIETLRQNLKEIKPTILVCVPRIFEKIHVGLWDKVKQGGKLKRKLFLWALKQEPNTWQHFIANALVFKKIQAAFGGHLRFAVSGGATLNHKLARFFHRVGIDILEGYGLTETAPIVSCNRLGNVSFGTVGQQLPGVEIMIAPDKEILVKGPNLMKGYYNNEQLTKEVIDEAGFFHTGDLGFLSSEGFLMIIGRKKEMISLSNGKIAWPEQLEILLNNDRVINQSFVYGNGKSYLVALINPDWQEVIRELGEELHATEPDELINNQKVIELINQRIEKINDQLANWEKVRKFVLIQKEFSQAKDEVTPSLKLRRHVISENYKNLIEKLYSH